MMHWIRVEDLHLRSIIIWKLQKSLIHQSEASYVYNLSGQKFIKNCENGQLREHLKACSLRSNSVARQVNFNKTKIGGKCQKSKIQMRQFLWFLNTVYKWP